MFTVVESLTQSSNNVSEKVVTGLMNELGLSHKPTEWQLFIDSSKTSLNVDFIRVDHAVNIKETYESMRKLFQSIKHEDH